VPGTRRTPLRRANAPRVSAHAVELFRECLRMQQDGIDESNRRTWLDLSLSLHRALNLRPWHDSVLHIDPDDDTPLDWDDMRGRQRALVVDLRRQLEAAAE
jgi:hypothetical protein